MTGFVASFAESPIDLVSHCGYDSSVLTSVVYVRL